MAKYKLNDKMQEGICKDIREGVPIIYAAQRNGICQSTFYDWYNKGKDAKSGKFRDFYNAIEEAKAEAIAFHAKQIHKASFQSWQASAWWLERVCPEYFGKKDHIELKAESKVKLGSLKEEEAKAEEYFKELDEQMK